MVQSHPGMQGNFPGPCLMTPEGIPGDYGADEKAWDSTRTEPNVFILFYLSMCLFDLKQAVTLVNMWAT
jgi:hypothetical protein